jgi:general secretion pathway protein B
MSYILEALRKAERERNAGQVPDIQVVSRSAPPAQKMPMARWLTLCAAVIIGIIVGLVFWIKSVPTVTTEHVSVPLATASAVVAVPVVEATSAIEAAEPQTNAARLDDLLDNTSDALPIDDQQKLSAEASPAAAFVVHPAPAATQAEQAQAEPELPAELKKIKEMPADYRNGFPPIRVDVHVYDEQPAKRFVMVNGRRYHEGETLSEGPRVVSIEEDGIVFNFRNEDVLYPIAR